MNRIFLDNAGTTRVHDQVLNAMSSFFTSIYTNKEINEYVEAVKIQILDLLNAEGYHLFFTTSGSEANNVALEVMAEMVREEGGPRGVLTSPYEHAAVYKTIGGNRFKDFQHLVLPVFRDGGVDMKGFRSMNTASIGMSSTMYVNNEIGRILPIDEILNVLNASKSYTHVDAVQALGHIHLDLKRINPDFMSLSGHKIHGPKGLGVLLVKEAYANRVRMSLGCREANLPYIVGFAKALELRYANLKSHIDHAEELRNHIETQIKGIHESIEVMGGPSEQRVPSIINLKVPHLDGDSIVLGMDLHGIAVSSGSACSSGAMEASHVILALGYDEAEAKHCFRISTSIFTRLEEVDRMLEVLTMMLEPYRKRREDVK